MTTLKHKVIRAGQWTILNQAATNVIRLGSNILLARLLMPADFALSATATSFMVAVAMTTDAGISEAVLRSKRGEERSFLNTAWTLQVIRGITLFGILALLGIAMKFLQYYKVPTEGTIYSDTRLPIFIVLTGITLLVVGFTSTRMLIARRAMEYKKLVRIEFMGMLISTASMLGLASLWQNAYALVVGGIIGNMYVVVASHVIGGPSPDRFEWEQQSLLEIRGFGQWIIVATILAFFANSADRMILGALMPAETLGHYHIAATLCAIVPTIYQGLLANVYAPSVTEVVRSRPDALPAIFKRFLVTSDLTLGLTCGFLLLAAPSIISILYPENYSATSQLLSALAVGVVGLRSRLVENLFLSTGETRLFARAAASKAAVVVIVAPAVGFAFGSTAAVLAISLSTFASLPLLIPFARTHKLNFAKNSVYLLPSIIAGCAIGWLVNRMYSWFS